MSVHEKGQTVGTLERVCGERGSMCLCDYYRDCVSDQQEGRQKEEILREGRKQEGRREGVQKRSIVSQYTIFRK